MLYKFIIIYIEIENKMEVVIMPFGDGTGPFGEGPMTGWGMGRCGANTNDVANEGQNTGNVSWPRRLLGAAFRWGRRWFGGRGRGFGRGRGMGRGRGW